MENGNLNTDELEVLRTAARDSFYIHAQVENANHKLEKSLYLSLRRGSLVFSCVDFIASLVISRFYKGLYYVV